MWRHYDAPIMAASSTKPEYFKYQSLHAAVKASGLTQQEIADRVGVDRTYITHLLRDGKRQPSLGIALKLSRVLDMDPAALA